MRAALLHILLDAAEAGEEVGRLAREQMIAVELSRDLHREVEVGPGRFHPGRLWHSAQEIACPWRCRGLGGSFADLGAKFVDEAPLEAKRAMITLEHREPMLLGRVGPRD